MMKKILNLLGKLLVFMMITTGMFALLVGLLFLVSRMLVLTLVGVGMMISGIVLISRYQEIAEMLIDMEVLTDEEP